ncbi:MAG: GNAT family N-acetyltransferase [Acidimicrobiales bacterium]
MASDHDLDRLVELTEAFHAERGDRRGAGLTHPNDAGGSPPETTNGSVSRYVAEPDRTALVGTLEGWVAGAALCRVDTTDGERRGVLDVCFVEPGAREVGLGQLLLERSIGWFRGQGCTGVDGSALPGDRGAKQFYESAGFKARLLVMHLSLD